MEGHPHAVATLPPDKRTWCPRARLVGRTDYQAEYSHFMQTRIIYLLRSLI